MSPSFRPPHPPFQRRARGCVVERVCVSFARAWLREGSGVAVAAVTSATTVLMLYCHMAILLYRSRSCSVCITTAFAMLPGRRSFQHACRSFGVHRVRAGAESGNRYNRFRMIKTPSALWWLGTWTQARACPLTLLDPPLFFTPSLIQRPRPSFSSFYPHPLPSSSCTSASAPLLSAPHPSRALSRPASSRRLPASAVRQHVAPGACGCCLPLLA